jgi:predicted Zn finger-like uncharacterized protein
MNVACSACPAKYAVPDDKVRGKRARITCKHCGTGIIIDGTGLGAIPSSSSPVAQASEPPRASTDSPQRVPAAAVEKGAPAAAPVSERALAREAPARAAPRSTEGPWVVAINDEHQESASIPRVVELFATGVIDGDTYLWREGMSDWKTPFEIPQIEAALRARGFFPPSLAYHQQPDEEATLIVPAPSEARAGRDLPRSSEDEESVTVARVTLDPRVARPPAEARRAPTNAAAGSPDAVNPRSEAAERQVRPRTITRLGMGSPSPSHSHSEPPAVRASNPPPPPSRTRAEPVVHAAHHNGASEGRHASQRPLPELRHAGLVSSAQPSNRAARKPHGRGVNGRNNDLFAQQPVELEEEAGLDQEPEEDDLSPRMTGARNESSVLFSLDALTQAEREPRRPRRPTPNSAELMFGVPPPPPAFDTGNQSAPLAAPDFMAPPREPPPPPPPLPPRPNYAAPPFAAQHYAPPPPAAPVFAQARPEPVYRQSALVSDDFDFRPPRRRGRAALVGLLLLAAAAGSAFALGLPQKYLAQNKAPPPEPPAIALQSHTALPEATPPEPVPSTPEGSASNPAAASASAEAPVADATAPSAPAPAIARASRPGPSTFTPRTSRAERESDQDDSEASSPSRTPRLAEALSSESSKKPDKPEKVPTEEIPTEEIPTEEIPTEVAPFDRNAAVTALTSVASSAQSCKMLGGPTGSGQATVTFAPSGRVTSASVSGDFAGSSVGSCIAKLFRNARVPAFAGGAVTVNKRFSIE